MAKKTIFREFDPVIYPFKFWVIINEDLSIMSERFVATDMGEIDFSDTDLTPALTIPVFERKGLYRRYGIVIGFREKRDINMRNVAHECSHATKRIFEHIGADPSAHETYEYLLGWFADCCEKTKNYTPKKRKKK